MPLILDEHSIDTIPIRSNTWYCKTQVSLCGMRVHGTSSHHWSDDQSIRDGSKHSQRSHKGHWMSNFVIKNLGIYLFISIWNYGNHGTLFFFNTHESQENQILNPFNSILSFGLVNDFWKRKFLTLKKDIFTK